MARSYEIRSGDADDSGFRSALNDEQYQAVVSNHAHALVIAGAGSGKTRTLTYRVAWLLRQGIKPWQILLLTFTNKAAREMIDRVRNLTTESQLDIWAGTFHAIASRILRRHAELTGLTRSYSILDRDDQKSLLSGLLKGMDLGIDQKKFPKADVLLSIYSLAANTDRDVAAVVNEKYEHFLEWLPQIEQLHQRFSKAKTESNSVDFDDLLLKTVTLLRHNSCVCEQYQRQFRHILVDEFQDSNAIQTQMIELLSGEHSQVMLVGDDAQSIYSWRGANMSHILEYPQQKRACKVYTIETNYRSVPEILDLSNMSIRSNTQRFDKTLRAVRASVGCKPALVPVEDPVMQAMFVSQRIMDLVESGVEYSDIAVLYRAHFHSMELQMELTRRGIPFAITSGIRFFEQAHIKDVCAFLRFVTNPRDEMAFKRMVLLLPGVGSGTAESMWLSWKNQISGGESTLPVSFSTVFGLIKCPKKSHPDWIQVGEILDEMHHLGQFVRPSSMIDSVLHGMYDDYLTVSFNNSEQRREDLDKLREFAGQFDDVLLFLEQLSLLGNQDSEDDDRETQQVSSQVTLSSIHQAKGLEWKVVFVIWLAEGQFPNARVLESLHPEDIEEERRLFYVAATRAEDELYLIYPMLNPKSYRGDILMQPSRFLADVDSDLMEEWDVGVHRINASDQRVADDHVPF